MADDRERRLAAIQARLQPPPAEGDAESSAAPAGGAAPGSSGSSTPLFGAPRHLPKPWSRPNERETNEKRRELARVLQRSIVRDNGYTQAAGCVETLLKIAGNIQTSQEEKFRRLKGDNSVLKHKVLEVKGGREFLILMGFRTETTNFIQSFVLDQSDKKMYELGLAAEVLRDALPDLQARVNQTVYTKSAHKAEEAARVALAKRQIEEDRDSVRQRVDRERIAREARAAQEAREAEEARLAEAQAEETGDQRSHPAPSAPTGPASEPLMHQAMGGVLSQAGDRTHAVGPQQLDSMLRNASRPPQAPQAHHDEDDEDLGEDDEDDDDDEEWNETHRWGAGGNRLGS